MAKWTRPSANPVRPTNDPEVRQLGLGLARENPHWDWIVIVSLHVATGAALGALSGSRLAALALGPPLHLACDRVPHEYILDRRFEIGSGLFDLALLALCRGLLDSATLGAASASAPDLEHIFPRLRPHGHKLFHGGRGWHRSGGFRADVQLVLAGAIIGLLVKPRSPAR